MKHFFVVIFLLFFSNCFRAQLYKTLFIFTTPPGDTVNYKLESKKTFSDSRQLLEEEQFDRKTRMTYSYKDSLLLFSKKFTGGKETGGTTYTYDKNCRVITTLRTGETGIDYSESATYFKNGLLKKTVVYVPDLDSIKTRYHYDKKGQLTGETEWTYKKKRKKQGRGEKSCIETGKDYKKKKTWVKTCVSQSKWNTNGQLIEYKNSVCSPSRNPLETWDWDSTGKLVLHRSFDKSGKLQSSYVYSYKDSINTIVTTNYDYDGAERQLKTESWEYMPKYFNMRIHNSQGKLLEEKTIDEKNNRILLRVFTYNRAGDLSKEIYRNLDGTLSYNKLYEYH